MKAYADSKLEAVKAKYDMAAGKHVPWETAKNMTMKGLDFAQKAIDYIQIWCSVVQCVAVRCKNAKDMAMKGLAWLKGHWIASRCVAVCCNLANSWCSVANSWCMLIESHMNELCHTHTKLAKSVWTRHVAHE